MVEMAVCSVPDCLKPVFVKGYCQRHYHRVWRLGDPEPTFKKHAPGTPVAVRFWSFVAMSAADDCWPWRGARIPLGYGRMTVDGQRVPAHRVAYELAVGPIPDGYEIDHLCHTRDLTCPGGATCPHRPCVNPMHLEAVTGKENRLRGRSFSAVNAAKTHCAKGHPYDEANTYVDSRGRKCRTCDRHNQRAYQQRKRSAV